MSVISGVNQQSNSANYDILVSNVVVSTYVLNANTSMMQISALVNQATIPLQEHVLNYNAILQWIAAVNLLFPNLVNNPPHTNSELMFKNPAVLAGDFTMDGYQFNLAYQRGPKMVEIKPRLAITTGWGSFLYFIQQQGDFINFIVNNP